MSETYTVRGRHFAELRIVYYLLAWLSTDPLQKNMFAPTLHVSVRQFTVTFLLHPCRYIKVDI